MKLLEEAGGKKSIVAGKPSKSLFDILISDHNLQDVPLDQFLMVGDKVDTDIQFGKNSGIDTLLVFTGVTKQDEYESNDSSENILKPTYTFSTLFS